MSRFLAWLRAPLLGAALLLHGAFALAQTPAACPSAPSGPVYGS